MKVRLIIKILICLTFLTKTYSQNNLLSVTGHVYDISTSAPISEHNVTVILTGGGFNNTFNFLTNLEGFWGSDSIFGFNNGTVQALTYDCNGQLHQFLENYSPNSSAFIFDFYICQDTVPSGDCMNWFYYEQTGIFTFQFQGESLPSPPLFYSWNFGDGQSGFGQNIVHTYNPVSGYQFNVQLTSVIMDPVTGDSCFATSDQWVFINNTPECEAGFYYFPDPLNPLTIHFLDNSTGIISNWYWDFNDGSVSLEINPVHTFSGPGNYNVCLSISSDSSGFICSDTFCLEVNISSGLAAGFIYSLDTVSDNAKYYFFTDTSIGTPDSWFWSFGDGNTSQLQNPEHQYSESGIYDVCLEVLKNFPSGGFISDMFCQQVAVPDYYDIGGLAFIGNTPINNPASTGDTGIAYLYRIYSDDIIPVDTNYFYEYGYYWFSQVREGNHIVKIGLTSNSLHFKQYTPAYFPDRIFWQNAQIIQVSDSNNYFANVYLTEIPGVFYGSGAIQGNVVDMQNPSLSDFVVGQPVFLYSISGELLDFTLTNMMGNFAFENIAFGTYLLTTDVTGYNKAPVTVTIDANIPEIFNVLIGIYEADWIGIPESRLTDSCKIMVFPNPANDILNLRILSENELSLTISILNIFGQEVFRSDFYFAQEQNTVQLPVNFLSSGIYIIKTESLRNNAISSIKFIKN